MNSNIKEIRNKVQNRKLYHILAEWQDDLINMNLRQKDVNKVLRKIRDIHENFEE